MTTAESSRRTFLAIAPGALALGALPTAAGPANAAGTHAELARALASHSQIRAKLLRMRQVADFLESRDHDGGDRLFRFDSRVIVPLEKTSTESWAVLADLFDEVEAPSVVYGGEIYPNPSHAEDSCDTGQGLDLARALVLDEHGNARIGL